MRCSQRNQNSFRLRGTAATVAGKPVPIAVKGGDAVIILQETDQTARNTSVP